MTKNYTVKEIRWGPFYLVLMTLIILLTVFISVIDAETLFGG
jgi:hypothetical protein